jgi:hypothetical protein
VRCNVIVHLLLQLTLNTGNFFGSLWTSTPKVELQHTKQKIQKHIEEFNSEVTLLDRKTVRKQNLDIVKTLRSPMSNLAIDDASSEDRKVHFPVSTITKYRNYSFLGRDSILENIREIFQNHPALDLSDATASTDSLSSDDAYEPACCILHGIGGVGKTQTALEYVRRYTKDFDAVFWLPAERDEDLRQTYAQIADKLKLFPAQPDMDGKEAKVGRVREWLEKTGKVLKLYFLLLTLTARRS